MSLMGTLSILNNVQKESFSLIYDLGKQYFGHTSLIDDVPIKLTQFCYIPFPEPEAITGADPGGGVLGVRKTSREYDTF